MWLRLFVSSIHYQGERLNRILHLHLPTMLRQQNQGNKKTHTFLFLELVGVSLLGALLSRLGVFVFWLAASFCWCKLGWFCLLAAPLFLLENFFSDI